MLPIAKKTFLIHSLTSCLYSHTILFPVSYAKTPEAHIFLYALPAFSKVRNENYLLVFSRFDDAGNLFFYSGLSCPFAFSEHANPVCLENAYSSVSFLYMVQVRLGFTYYLTREEKKGNQVRESHEAVYDISQRPDGFQLQEDCGSQHGDVAHAVHRDGLRAEEVFPAAFPIVVPSDDGGESKER